MHSREPLMLSGRTRKSMPALSWTISGFCGSPGRGGRESSLLVSNERERLGKHDQLSPRIRPKTEEEGGVGRWVDN